MNLFAPEHLLIVVIVAMIFLKPEELPALMRKLGAWYAKARGVIDDLRGHADGFVGDLTGNTGDLVGTVTSVAGGFSSGLQSILTSVTSTVTSEVTTPAPIVELPCAPTPPITPSSDPNLN